MRRSRSGPVRRWVSSAATGPASLRSSRCSSARRGPSACLRVRFSRRARVGYLPQVPVPGGLGTEPTGFSHVLSAKGLDLLDDALVRRETRWRRTPTPTASPTFSDLEEEYSRLGGYEAEAVMSRLADGLGLDEGMLLEDLEGLSGGQRRRVDLVRVLFAEPDLLVLDEPTNHLDRSAKRWLMEELERFTGSVLLISHDLRLLDRAITKVLNLADAQLTEHPGNYTSFRASSPPTRRSANGRRLSRVAR